jgi:hypothetical protein
MYKYYQGCVREAIVATRGFCLRKLLAKLDVNLISQIVQIFKGEDGSMLFRYCIKLCSFHCFVKYPKFIKTLSSLNMC